MQRNNEAGNVTVGALGLLGGLAIIVILMFGWPTYRVWAKEQNGRAILAEATYSRQALVRKAEAERDAAVLLAEKEVISARGTNQANQIMQEALGGPENYLRWKFLNVLEETSDKPNREVFYIATEGGMPILTTETNSKRE